MQARHNFAVPAWRSSSRPARHSAGQRIVTCRFASPAAPTAPRSVSGSPASASAASKRRARAPPTGSSSASGAGADRQVPHRDEQPVGAEHPDEPAALDELVLAGGVQPGERVEQRRPRRAGSTQRRCSLVPTSVQYAASTDGQPGRRRRRGVGLLERGGRRARRGRRRRRPRSRSRRGRSPTSGSSATRSCSRGPSPGCVGQADHRAGLGVEGARAARRRGRGSGRRTRAAPAGPSQTVPS